MNALTHPAAQKYAAHVNAAFVKVLGAFGSGRIWVRAKGTRLSRVALCRGRDHIVVPVVDLLDEDDDGMTPDYFLG